VICSSNFIFRSGPSRRYSVRIFLRSLILAHSRCCPRFGFCLVSPCRSEPVQVFFLSQIDFSFGDSCVSTATGQFLLSTDLAQHLGFFFLGPRASTSGCLLGRPVLRPAFFTERSFFFLLDSTAGGFWFCTKRAHRGLGLLLHSARILVSSASHAQAARVLGFSGRSYLFYFIFFCVCVA
jgi:hypothetical protein